MPLDIASYTGGKLMRLVGNILPISKIAKRNLELTKFEETELIISEMWENIGRTLGEFPHISNISNEKLERHIELIGKEILEKTQLSSKNGVIIFSGHFANWELLPRMAYIMGSQFALVYRPANNPLVDRLLGSSRLKSHAGLYPKGRESTRKIIEALKDNRPVGILTDQKLNEGIEVDLLGLPAMTTTVISELTLKYGCPLIPVHIQRKKGCNFRITIEKPLNIEKTGNHKEDVKRITQSMNRVFESWIKDSPGQWLWLHRRFDKKLYED